MSLLQLPALNKLSRSKYDLFASPGNKGEIFGPVDAAEEVTLQAPEGKVPREDYLVKEMSAQEVQDLVRGDRDVPLIIDFYATWCGPCILMAQELEMLAVDRKNNAITVKVDKDDECRCAACRPYPKKEAILTEGLIPLQMIRDILDNDM